jgi:hypothetical protein
MAQYVSIASLVFTLALAFAWPCSLAAQPVESEQSMGHEIAIRIGDKSFAATLADNATATAFKKLLPLSVTMTELNGNEKLFRLPGTLPARASTPSSIQTGDLMLYGVSTLVLFYKSFPTTYSYTTIGRIDDPAGLEAAVGSGSVAVTFEVRLEKRQVGFVTGSQDPLRKAAATQRNHQLPRSLAGHGCDVRRAPRCAHLRRGVSG